MRIRFLMLGMVIAALACACRDAHAQCQDWADGFGQNEMGTDFLVYSLLATVEDGQEVLYVGGNFNRIGGIQASRIARWDGSQWSALGAGVDGSVQAMAVYDDGSGPALYVGGSFQNAGGQPAQGLARWKDGQWSSVGGNVVRNTVQAITVHDSRLIIGGTFSQIDGQPTQRLAAWDGVGWEAFSSGPSARTGHALAYDAARAVTVLFGGKEPGGGIEQQDTWTFDGQAWKRVALDGPERRLGHAMTYDSLRGRILMMGGQPRGWGGATDLRLWGWDGASWTVLTGAMPITRRDIRIAYDSARDRVVWFGGQDGSGTLFDSTWEYDGTSWFEVFPSTRPPARSKYALAYDEGRQRIVMYGGLAPEGCCHGDTWEWDGTDWTLVATTGPGQRNSHAMAYDAQNGHIVMYGGFVDAGQATDTWAWDGVTWTLLAPTDPSRPSDTYGPMAYDEVIDRIVMRDGLATTWLWDGWAWSFLNIGGLNNEVFALASFDSGAGPELYAGGAFTRAGAVAASRIARLGPSGWEPLGEGLQHDCMALRVWNDGGGDALYVGGKFNTADGNKAAGIARWDGSAWSLLNVGDPADGGGVSGVVWAISPGDDGTGEKLYVAGSFDFADGPGSGNQGDIEALNVARWDGSAWEALGGASMRKATRPSFAPSPPPSLMASPESSRAVTSRAQAGSRRGGSPSGAFRAPRRSSSSTPRI